MTDLNLGRHGLRGARVRLLLSGSLAGAIAIAASSGAARAQSAIERHPPPQPVPAPASLTIGEQDFGKASDRPLGVQLSGIHLIGEGAAVAKRPGGGITGTPEGIDREALDAALSPFLDRPLSLQLARDVQAAIAKRYRASGHPFVSVTLPPQEVTSGVLQVRVIEFRVGRVAVGGVPAGSAGAAAIRRRLRAAPGERIDARALREDLSWLNRSPYRRAEGVFRPGEETALSDLGVTVTRGKPWRANAGWSNTGSEATGRDRYFVGLGAWLPALGGARFSYQLTGGPDFWSDPGRISLDHGHFPDYLSQAGRIVIPTWPRQELEIAPALVASREAAGPFTTFENTTFELPVIYRSAVSNFLPGHYWGNVYGGVEVKTLERRTFFAGVPVASGDADLFQIVAGWSNTFDDAFGVTSVDARIKADPGGVLGGNDAATWSRFSNGRVDDVTYAYGALDVTRRTRLPRGLSWVSEFSGVLAGQPLPDTERLSLGGLYATRGYNFDDVSVDSGFVWRNELRGPTFSPLSSVAGRPDALSPYLFADFGYGEDLFTKRDYTLAGIGAGFDYTVADHFSTTFAAGYALDDAGYTQAGDWTVQARISASF